MSKSRIAVEAQDAIAAEHAVAEALKPVERRLVGEAHDRLSEILHRINMLGSSLAVLGEAATRLDHIGEREDPGAVADFGIGLSALLEQSSREALAIATAVDEVCLFLPSKGGAR